MKLVNCSLVTILILCLVFQNSYFPHYCRAEVSTDGSLGATVTLEGPDITITSDLGQIKGQNLFHSFSQFNIQTNQIATFSGPASVENIISRVTGGNASYIDGKLQSTIDGADLYLLNPFGVMFGPWAELDIKGSFHTSTADYLNFSNNEIFHADLSKESILSVADPQAFGFLTDNPSAITIDSSQLEVPLGETFSLTGGNIDIQGTDTTTFINAPQGKLQFVGVGISGEITIESPKITSGCNTENGSVKISGSQISDPYNAASNFIIKGGRIQIINTSTSIEGTKVDGDTSPAVDMFSTSSIGLSGSSFLCFSAGAEKGGDLNINATDFFMDDASWIDVIAAQSGGGGNILINTDNMELEGGSEIMASSYENGDSGNIFIDVAEKILLNFSNIKTIAHDKGATGIIEITTQQLEMEDTSSVFALSYIDGNCNQIGIDASEALALNNSSSIEAIYTGGDSDGITINTPKLTLENDSKIKTHAYGVYGQGTSGPLRLNVDGELFISTSSSIGAYASYDGNLGDISILCSNMVLESGGSVWSILWGSGDQGNMEIQAKESISIQGDGLTGLLTGIKSGASDAMSAGNISISTPYLELLNYGNIFSTSSGENSSGDLVINTDVIYMDYGKISSSGSLGESGDIVVKTNILEAVNNSDFVASTFDKGNAGTISIFSDELLLLDDSEIFNSTNDIGEGGDINIVSNQVTLQNNAAIQSDSSAEGKGGNISIKAKNLSITGIENGNGVFNSITSLSRGSGDAGVINIDIQEEINLSDGGKISTDTTGQGKGGDIHITSQNLNVTSQSEILAKSSGTGDAGNVTIAVLSNLTSQNSEINTQASQADGGDIEVHAGKLISLKSGKVLASVDGGPGTTGGNINLSSKNIIMDEDSQIYANAFEGQGGRINISSTVFLKEPLATIDASSKIGIDGIVEIDAAFTNLSGSLKPLAADFLNAASLIKAPCDIRVKDGDYGSFTVKGRDGLPIEPGGFQISPMVDF